MNQETIIILHGWQSSKEKWEKVGREIEKLGIKVIIPDLPGFKKETELSSPWDLDDYVEWFKNFSSGISEEFFLLGHSFGGRIAMKFSTQYPQKLKGLILVSAAGIIREKTDYEKLISQLVKKGKKLSFLPFYPVLRKFFYKYILRKTDYLRAEKIPFLQETFKNVIREDLTEHLSEIKTDTLIIWGEKDKITPLSDAYIMKEKIKNSKLEILKNINHFPHREASEILAKKIINFIKNVYNIH